MSLLSHKQCSKGDVKQGNREKAMWMLVIILLNSIPGVNTVTALQTFANAEEDQIGRNL